MSDRILIITNGDSAVDTLKEAGIVADFLPWRDVLHDGPVPANLTLEELSLIRAKFISELGWGEHEDVMNNFKERDKRLATSGDYEEVILWFEHDLYDQLQLIQLLDWFSQHEFKKTKLSIICKDEFVANSSKGRLLVNYSDRSEITSNQLASGYQSWLAFCSPNPKKIVEIITQDISYLPYLQSAFLRLLQEYPDKENGLSRNQSQILKIVQSNMTQPGEIFKESHKMEEANYLGDASFWQHMYGMNHCDFPLLQAEGSKPFFLPSSLNPDQEFLQQRLILTELGQQVILNKTNWVEINGIDKWLGGVHVTRKTLWYWDNTKQILIKEE